MTRNTSKRTPAGRPAGRSVAISREEAVDALSRSGYLLESRVGATLADFATHLSMNIAFSDPETGHTRELDAYCFRGELSDEHEFLSVSAHLLIECVNNPQPIAFFGSTLAPALVPIVAAQPAWLGPTPMEDSIGLEKFHHSFRLPVASNYCTFVTKNSGGWMVTHAEDQHREFSTLAALAHLTREKQLSVMKEFSRPSDGHHWCGLELIYPVLVVQGKLFMVSQDSGGAVELCDVGHLCYSKSHIFKGARRYCPIEVVAESYFPKLLRLIQRDCRRTLRILERRSSAVLEASRNQDDYPSERPLPEEYLP